MVLHEMIRPLASSPALAFCDFLLRFLTVLDSGDGRKERWREGKEREIEGGREERKERERNPCFIAGLYVSNKFC